MKEFMVVVKCKDATELRTALEETLTEVEDNLEAVNRLEVDEQLDYTGGGVEEITLQRCR